MTDIDDLELQHLTRARAFIEPDGAAFERVRAALEARLASMPAGGDPAPLTAKMREPGESRLIRALGSRASVAVIAALGGGAAGFGLGHLSGRQQAPSQSAVVVLPATTPRSGETEERSSPDAGVAAPARAVSDLPSRPELAPSSSARSEPGTPASALPEQSGASDTLAEELSGLRRAERSIRANNPRLALALLGELDSRFPDGQLRVERGAARVMANCQLLGADSARGAGRAYLDANPGTPYGNRVSQICGLSRDERIQPPAAKGSTPSGN